MNDRIAHTEEYKFYSNTLVHLLVGLLDWVIVRAILNRIDHIVISYELYEWRAVVYYWAKDK